MHAHACMCTCTRGCLRFSVSCMGMYVRVCVEKSANFTERYIIAVWRFLVQDRPHAPVHPCIIVIHWLRVFVTVHWAGCRIC